MDDNREFGENPFRDLDLAKFRNADDQPNATGLTSLERELFLKACEHLPVVKQKRATGFFLSEVCSLPDIRMKKKRHNQPVARKTPKPEEPEEDSFLLAMRNTKPLSNRGRDVAPRPAIRPAHPLKEHTLDDFMAGKLEFAVSCTNEYLEGHVVGMDELGMNRLREGQYSAEAHLDLHGLNSDQAFESLKVFIRNAWLKDLRCVLVVTGRGRNSPDGQAVLRQRVQSWLTKEPFKRVVMAFCTAKPHDGGPGSIYVLLRRFRKKGPIQWERIFMEGDDL